MARAPHRPPASGPVVHRITGVRRSLTEDIQSRQVRYLVSMGIRTICFVLAIVTRGWLQAIFFVGALVLPYIAVVIANAGRESADPTPLIPPTAATRDRPWLIVGRPPRWLTWRRLARWLRSERRAAAEPRNQGATEVREVGCRRFVVGYRVAGGEEHERRRRGRCLAGSAVGWQVVGGEVQERGLRRGGHGLRVAVGCQVADGPQSGRRRIAGPVRHTDPTGTRMPDPIRGGLRRPVAYTPRNGTTNHATAHHTPGRYRSADHEPRPGHLSPRRWRSCFSPPATCTRPRTCGSHFADLGSRLGRFAALAHSTSGWVIGQPPMADMDRCGWRNAGSSMPWPAFLPSTATRQRSASACVGLAGAQRCPEIRLLASEQAVAHLAVSGQADPVAVAAERAGHRGDHADPARAAVDEPRLGRGAPPDRCTLWLEDEPSAQAIEDLVGGDHPVAGPAVLSVERHLLDEPQLVAPLQAPLQEIGRLVVVHAAHEHRVDLDRDEAGRGRSREPVDHVRRADRGGSAR